MSSILISMGVSVSVVLVWFGIQQVSRAYHARHPEALPALEAMGCHHCGSADSCVHPGELDAHCKLIGKVEDRA